MRIKFGRALIALGLILGGMAIAAPASASNNNDHKVTICHATPPQNAKNGWNSKTLDKNAVFKDGHDRHSADIIPSFPYKERKGGKNVTKTYPGKNLNTQFGWGVTGQEILNNGCKIPDRPVPSQPEDKITYGDWSDEIIDCQQGIVYKTRAVYTTPYVFDKKSWTWVPGETVTTSETETLREATDQECGIQPPKPDDIVTYTEWEDGKFDCGDTVVVQSRIKSVTTHVFDEQLWEWVASNPVETIEYQDRVLSEEEIIPCEVPVECAEVAEVYVSNLDTKHFNVENGHFVEGGIKIWVNGNWDETYISKSFDGTLADLGTVLDIEADPIRYVGLHIVTDKGVIVYEEEPSYNNNLWSNTDFGVSSGMGYASFAPLADYVAANPDLHVSEIRVLYTHPEESFTIVNSVIVGCTKYVFGFEEEPEEEQPPTTVPPTTQPPVTTPPTTQPPVTTPPTTVPTDTVPTDTVPVDVSSNTQTNTDPQTEVLSENVEAEELAFTGSNSKPMAALGAILLAAGLGLVAFDRKRKNIA